MGKNESVRRLQYILLFIWKGIARQQPFGTEKCLVAEPSSWARIDHVTTPYGRLRKVLMLLSIRLSIINCGVRKAADSRNPS